MNHKTLKKTSYWLLSGPAVLVYALIIIFPVVVSFVLSFTQWSGFGMPQFVGLKNYIDIFKDSYFWWGIRNNILVVAISVLGQIPVGFVLAYILYRKMVKGGNFFEAMIFLPITISSVVVALLWRNIFGNAGIFTQIMRNITHDPRWILSITEVKELSIIPILVVILWMYTGMYMIIFLANMQKISPSVLEAAIIDGASEGQILLRIILPHMTNIIFTTAVLAISGSLKSFDLIFAMTQGGPARYTEVVAIYMYMNTFKYFKYGFGSAVSMFIVAISVGLIQILNGIFSYFERKFS
ncbi:MAG: sugar ABC transporter permease [Spirochaetales bacterium]|nr:sugar ABC transporter permease [Spirochaetales bacterium]